MPEIDLSFTITGIIALSAIISPIITTWINNYYQSKRENTQNYELSKRDCLIAFIKSATNVHQHKTTTLISEFNSALNNLYIFFPNVPNSVHNLIDTDYKNFNKNLNDIVIKLSKQIQKK